MAYATKAPRDGKRAPALESVLVKLQKAERRGRMIELSLPYPPSKNALRGYGRGRVYRTDKYADWLKVAGNMVMAARCGGITGRYKLTIMALRPDNRKRDLGNLLEATEDLLKSVGVIEDDSLSEMICLRWVTNGSPFTVRVEPAGVE